MKKSKENTRGKENFQNSFYDDYLDIMRTGGSDFISNTEWQTSGDQFKKLTMYEDYTPVKTSSNTKSK